MTKIIWLGDSFPALVGNKRMYGRCGCKLVITSQEIALLLLPDSEDEGAPARWRRSSNILTPSHLAGVWGEDQKGCRGKVMSPGVNKLKRPILPNSIYSRGLISKMQ